MKPHTDKDELTIIAKEMRSDGISYQKIADNLGIKSSSTIYEWINPDKTKEASSRYRDKNKEYIKDRKNAWAAENREYNLERGVVYRDSHREELREKSIAYHLEQKDPMSDLYRSYVKNSKEKELADRAAYKAGFDSYCKEHEEEFNACYKYIEEQAAKEQKEYRKNYKINHREKSREDGRRRRANMHMPEKIDKDQYDAIFDEQEGLCFYCDEPMVRDRDRNSEKYYNVEHVNPVDNGGFHELSNIVYSCALCNQRKGAQLVEEWKPEIMDKIYSHERLEYDIEENNKRWLI